MDELEIAGLVIKVRHRADPKFAVLRTLTGKHVRFLPAEICLFTSSFTWVHNLGVPIFVLQRELTLHYSDELFKRLPLLKNKLASSCMPVLHAFDQILERLLIITLEKVCCKLQVHYKELPAFLT